MLYARVTYDANSGKNGDDDNDYQEFDNSESGCGFPHRYEYTPPLAVMSISSYTAAQVFELKI